MESALKMCGKQGYATCICDKRIHFCYKHAKDHIKIPGGLHKLFIFQKTSLFYEKCKFVFEHTNKIKNNLIYKSNNLRNVKSDRMLDEKNEPQFPIKGINNTLNKNYSKSNIIQKIKEDYESIFRRSENQNRIGTPDAHPVYDNRDRILLMKNKLIETYKIFLEGPKDPILCIELTSDNKYIVLGLYSRTILI